MDTTYIIFKKSPPDQGPVWMETIQGLVKAKRRLQHYAAASDEQFFVFDVHEAKIVNILAKAKSK